MKFKPQILFLLLACFCAALTHNAYAQNSQERISIQLKSNRMLGTPQPLSTAEGIELTRLFMQQKGMLRCESDLKNRQFVLVYDKGCDIQAILSQMLLLDALQALGYQIDAVADGSTYAQQIAAPSNTALPQQEVASNAPIYKGGATTTADQQPAAAANAKKSSKKNATKEQQPDLKATDSAIEANTNAATLVPNKCNDCGEQKISDEMRQEVLKNADFGGDAMDFGDGSMDEGGEGEEQPALTPEQLESLQKMINGDNQPPK